MPVPFDISTRYTELLAITEAYIRASETVIHDRNYCSQDRRRQRALKERIIKEVKTGKQLLNSNQAEIFNNK